MERVRNTSVHVGTCLNMSEPWVGAWERPWHIGMCQYRREHVSVSALAIDFKRHGAGSLDLSSSVLHAHGVAQVSKFCVLHQRLSLHMDTQDNRDVFDTSINGSTMLYTHDIVQQVSQLLELHWQPSLPL